MSGLASLATHTPPHSHTDSPVLSDTGHLHSKEAGHDGGGVSEGFSGDDDGGEGVWAGNDRYV